MKKRYARYVLLFVAIGIITLFSQFLFNGCSGSSSSSTSGKPVEGLVITPGRGQVALKWKPSAGAKTYTIFWDSEPLGAARSYFLSGPLRNKIPGISSTAYFHMGLNEGKRYFYEVISDAIADTPPPPPAGNCTLPNGCYFLTPYLCGETCVSLMIDDNNCGSCGNVCPTGMACFDGICTPKLENGCTANAPYACNTASGTHFCSNGNLAIACGPNCTDCIANAGGGNAACVNGACQTCAEGEFGCKDGCVNTNYDPKNCGACGNVCPDKHLCAKGVCIHACEMAEGMMCNGVCVDPKKDTNNCGACGAVCPNGQVCNNGSCGNFNPCGAMPGSIMCNGVCLTPNTNTNCGSCGKVCPSGTVCNNGSCVNFDPCAPLPGSIMCNGVCLVPNTASNCGACGNACSARQSCVGGRCV